LRRKKRRRIRSWYVGAPDDMGRRKEEKEEIIEDRSEV
jgi:hypothetical protein